MQVLSTTLAIGLFFSVFASLMAYLITYREYQHHYPTSREPRRIAVEAAVVVFLFFVGFSLLAGYMLMQLR